MMGAAKTITLRNKWLTAVFAEENGALVSLVHQTTGWQLLGRPELGLSFRMLLPLPDRCWNLTTAIN